jgi:molybdate transport system permease protein
MNADVWQALALTFRLAAATTVILLLVGLPLAHWLNAGRGRIMAAVEALVSLPIVLPPTVIGFYLLILFSPQNPAGAAWEGLTGHTLAFSFSGLVVGSVLYSLPFAVQPFQAALRSVSPALVEAARVAGAGPWQVFWHVTLPLARRGIGTGLTLSFAHTVGEFGVVLMLGGAIPGITKVASILLYDDVQRLDYGRAHVLALLLLACSFGFLLLISLFQRRGEDDVG